MSHPFWESLRLFERERRNLTQAHADLFAEMREIKFRTLEVIADSRIALQKADEILALDRQFYC